MGLDAHVRHFCGLDLKDSPRMESILTVAPMDWESDNDFLTVIMRHTLETI